MRAAPAPNRWGRRRRVSINKPFFALYATAALGLAAYSGENETANDAATIEVIETE